MRTSRSKGDINRLLKELEAKHKKPLVYLGFGPLPVCISAPVLTRPGIRIVQGDICNNKEFTGCTFDYENTEYITFPDVAKEIGLENYGVHYSFKNIATKKITL